MHLLIALQTRPPCDLVLSSVDSRHKGESAPGQPVTAGLHKSNKQGLHTAGLTGLSRLCLGSVQSSFKHLLLSAASQLQLHHQPCINLYSLLKHMQPAVAPMGHKATHEQVPWSASLHLPAV